MLEVSSFSKEYNGHTILNVPQLSVPAGVSWFQGVNGSGKSTFFKAISGIIPFDGEVSFTDGLSLKKSPVDFRRRINYSFAEPRYPEFVSGKEILEYHLKTYRGSRRDLDRLLELFGVTAYYHTKIATYSSGMLKKISLIAAFIGSPEILALDEPFTTIDIKTQEILLSVLSECHHKGQSILVASHHDWSHDLLKIDHHFKVENQTIHVAS